MMKTKFNFIIAAIAVCLVWNCKGKQEQKKNAEPPRKDSLVQEEFHKELYGLYTGGFSGDYSVTDADGDYYELTDEKIITLKINRITIDSVYGQSVVNGNQRPFRGVYFGDSKTFVLDEPGDDPTDGRFDLKIKGDSLAGLWTAYNKTKVKAPKKALNLSKKQFVYNPNFMLDEDRDLVDWTNPKEFMEKYTDEDGHEEKYKQEKYRMATDAIFKLNASKQKLTEAELKNLRKIDLEIIKNSIYARHGYSFKKETFRRFFEETPWYIPISNDVQHDLSSVEKENVELLSRFIQYAEDKYDYFGR